MGFKGSLLSILVVLLTLGILGSLGCGSPSIDNELQVGNRTKQQMRSFESLNGPTQPLPERLARRFRSFRDKRLKYLRVEHAKHIGSRRNGLWVVNGKGITCIIQTMRGSIACSDTADFLDRGLIIGAFGSVRRPTERPDLFIVWGIAPDWISKVRLKVGQKFRMIKVQNNFYSLRASSPIFFAGPYRGR
jgi:hypothetical protein